jgi:hypothetical protein
MLAVRLMAAALSGDTLTLEDWVTRPATASVRREARAPAPAKAVTHIDSGLGARAGVRLVELPVSLAHASGAASASSSTSSSS